MMIGVIGFGASLQRISPGPDTGLACRCPAYGVLLCAVLGITAPARAQWTRWGGPTADFTAPASNLADRWGEDGPKHLWSRWLGEGFSSILVDGNRLFTMYRHGGQELVVCLDAATGSTIWQYGYEVNPAPNHVPLFRNGEGPHATPLIVGNHIYSIGIAGTLTCLDKDKGTLLWKRELWGTLGGAKLDYGYSASPIAFQDVVIVLVGGAGVGLAALDRSTGDVRWTTPEFKVSYCTPKLIVIDERTYVVAALADDLVIVDPTDGTVEWRRQLDIGWEQTIAPPLWDAMNNLLLVSVNPGGSSCFKLRSNGHGIDGTLVWHNPRVQFYCTTPVWVNGWVYGSSGASSPYWFVGVNMATGEVAWRVRSTTSAMLVSADGRLILLFEDGRLALATATPAGLTMDSETRLFEDKGNAWAVPTVVGQKLYARDSDIMVALDLH